MSNTDKNGRSFVVCFFFFLLSVFLLLYGLFEMALNCVAKTIDFDKMNTEHTIIFIFIFGRQTTTATDYDEEKSK